MHSAATALITVVAAEKSKVPFYIVGGVLATWAVVLSVLIGLRKPAFPGGLEGQRVVIAISVLLVAGAISAAVLTSGSPKKSGEAAAAASTASNYHTAGPGYIAEGTVPAAGAPAPSAAAPAPATTTPATTPASTTPATTKTATTKTATTKTATTKTASTPTTPATSGAVTQAISTVPLSAVPNAIAFNTKSLAAKAGKVTIAFTNSGALEHNVTIAQGSTVLGATPTFTAGSKSLTLTLKPGSYTFYCSVPGHRAAGMEGTLKIT